MFLTKPYQILPFSKRQNTPNTTETALFVCLMLTTFLSENLCVSYQALLPAVWLQNYFSDINVMIGQIF